MMVLNHRSTATKKGDRGCLPLDTACCAIVAMITPLRSRRAAAPLWFVLFVLACGVAHAQSRPVEDASAPDAAIAIEEAASQDEDEKRLRFAVGGDIYSAYYFRGMLVEDQGFIFQPYANVEFDLISNDALTLTLDAGVWDSFQSAKTDADSELSDFMQTWYDSDYDLGAAVAWDHFSLRLGLAIYTSPSRAYDRYQELTLTFEIDDSDWLGAWAMSPYVMIAYEISDNGSDGEGLGHDAYLEFGVTPGFDLDNLKPLPEGTRIDLPVVLGLGLHDYYETDSGANQTFGYLSLGVLATVPIPIIDGLSLAAGVDFLILGQAAREFNTNEDSTEWVWHVGLAMEF